MFVIYHAGCMDGFIAAWCAWMYANEKGEAFGCCEATYGSEPPWDKIDGETVYILDFSYPRNTLSEIHKRAKHLLVLDHHKTAEAELADLDYATFDMNRSGAGMAWDYFFTKPRPWLVDYVEDRDMWWHSMPHTKEVNLWLTTQPKDFMLMAAMAHNAGGLPLARAISEGTCLQAYYQQRVDQLTREARVQVVGGTNAAIVNCPHHFASDVSSKLAQSYDLVLLWSQDKSGLFRYSARSADKFDCSAFAKQYGGGGHKNAAGFSSQTLLW